MGVTQKYELHVFFNVVTVSGRHENVHPPLDFTRILKSCQKRNEKLNPGKTEAKHSTWDEIGKDFSVN